MRLPSKGMVAPISCMRGSLIIRSFAESRAALFGYSNQAKTTSSSVRGVHRLAEVGDLAFGHVARPGLDVALHAEIVKDRRGVRGMLAILFAVRFRHRHDETFEISHLHPPSDGRGARPLVTREIRPARRPAYSRQRQRVGRQARAGTRDAPRARASKAARLGVLPTISVWRSCRSTATIIMLPIEKRSFEPFLVAERVGQQLQPRFDLLDHLRTPFLRPLLAAVEDVDVDQLEDASARRCSAPRSARRTARIRALRSTRQQPLVLNCQDGSGSRRSRTAGPRRRDRRAPARTAARGNSRPDAGSSRRAVGPDRSRPISSSAQRMRRSRTRPAAKSGTQRKAVTSVEAVESTGMARSLA